MKKLLSVLLVSLAITPVAFADSVTISTGVRGGKYDGTYGANLAKFLRAKGHTVTLEQSAGSEENLKRVSTNAAQITFATTDAYAFYLASGGQPLGILSDLGTECGYMVVKKGGKVTSEADLQKVKDAKIAIGDSGSGSEIMWRYMTQLEPKYKNAAVVLQGGTMAINAIGTTGGPDAYLFVTSKNNLTHKLVQAVNANKGLEFVSINDWDLNSKLPNGKPIYQFEKNTVCDGWGCGVETICTTGSLYYSEQAPKAVIEDISDILALSKKAVTGE